MHIRAYGKCGKTEEFETKLAEILKEVKFLKNKTIIEIKAKLKAA